MKKFLSVLLIAFMAMSLTSCEWFKNKQEKEEPVAQLNVENLVSIDKEYMFLNYGEDYKWYETCVLMNNFLDEESDGSIYGVTNIFQTVKEIGEEVEGEVILISHTMDTTCVETEHGFWIEDFDLNEKEINITFEEAYCLIMSNLAPKPHSKNCVLRSEVGPLIANPQYIFGNQQAQIYVDATDGTTSDKNPVFPHDIDE